MIPKIAMVLAAGVGTRLKPATDLLPKPLLPLAGLPLILYPLAFLWHAGLRTFYINVHHHRDLMQRFFAEAQDKLDVHLIDEPVLLGTGGGLKNMAHGLPGSIAGGESLVVMNSDIVMDGNLEALLTHHRSYDNLVTLALWPRDAGQHYSPIVADSQGRILKFMDDAMAAGSSGLGAAYFFTGLHVTQVAVAKGLRGEGTCCLFRQGYLPLLARDEAIRAYPWQGLWLDCGDWSSLAQTQRTLGSLDSLSYRGSLDHLAAFFAPAIHRLRENVWAKIEQSVAF